MKERYYSLDVFRGATIAFMILVNNQAGPSYAPLDHAPWHGLTPTDLVFPFFLFAVGNALSFVMPRFRQLDLPAVLQKIIKRSALIFLIGFLLNWFPFLRWDHDSLVIKTWTWINDQGVLAGVRVMSVLGRIALCYLFGSLKTLFGPEHLYHGEGVAFDPEGIPSTLAAITQVVFGYIVGWYIQQKGKNYLMLRTLLLAAVALLALGYAWSTVFPINKKIWTSSFVLVSTGYAILMLLVLIFIIEFRHWTGWGSKFFDVFGKNPLFIFVLSGAFPRLLALIRIPNPAGGPPAYLSPLGWFYKQVCQPLTAGNLKNASLLYALVLVFFYWAIGYVLDRRKIYIRV